MSSDARAALITGGSGGIGLAIARALGQDGYRVTVSARRPEKLEAAAQELAGEGIEVDSIPANMAEEDDIKKTVDGHRERFGRLDVLINNAGIGIGAAVADTETKKLDLQLDVNLRAVYPGGTRVHPHAQGGGRRARQGPDRQHRLDRRQERAGRLSAYSATKFGVVGLARPCTRSCRATDPGDRPVPRLRGHRDDRLGRGSGAKDRMIQPEDIAESVRFLLRTSPNCLVPEVQFVRPGDSEG